MTLAPYSALVPDCYPGHLTYEAFVVDGLVEFFVCFLWCAGCARELCLGVMNFLGTIVIAHHPSVLDVQRDLENMHYWKKALVAFMHHLGMLFGTAQNIVH